MEPAWRGSYKGTASAPVCISSPQLYPGLQIRMTNILHHASPGTLNRYLRVYLLQNKPHTFPKGLSLSVFPISVNATSGRPVALVEILRGPFTFLFLSQFRSCHFSVPNSVVTPISRRTQDGPSPQGLQGLHNLAPDPGQTSYLITPLCAHSSLITLISSLSCMYTRPAATSGPLLLSWPGKLFP